MEGSVPLLCPSVEAAGVLDEEVDDVQRATGFLRDGVMQARLIELLGTEIVRNLFSLVAITIMPPCGRKNNENDYDKDLLGEEMVGIDISGSASTFTIRERRRKPIKISTYAGRQGVGDVHFQVGALPDALEQVLDAVVRDRALQLRVKLRGRRAVGLDECLVHVLHPDHLLPLFHCALWMQPLVADRVDHDPVEGVVGHCTADEKLARPYPVQGQGLDL